MAAYKFDKAEANERANRLLEGLPDAHFRDPKDRVPDPIAEADYQYRMQIKEHSKGNYGEGRFANYYSHPSSTFN